MKTNATPEPLYKGRQIGATGPMYSEPHTNPEFARTFCHEAVFHGATFASVLRDSQGSDHPDNAGKFFLHQIVKG